MVLLVVSILHEAVVVSFVHEAGPSHCQARTPPCSASAARTGRRIVIRAREFPERQFPSKSPEPKTLDRAPFHVKLCILPRRRFHVKQPRLTNRQGRLLAKEAFCGSQTRLIGPISKQVVGQIGPNGPMDAHSGLKTGASRLGPQDWGLKTGASRLGPQDWGLKTRASRLGPTSTD